jgi:hypothetical protein
LPPEFSRRNNNSFFWVFVHSYFLFRILFLISSCELLLHIQYHLFQEVLPNPTFQLN